MKVAKVFLFIPLVFGLSACQLFGHKTDSGDKSAGVAAGQSLNADKREPEERRKENDEITPVFELMKNSDQEPAQIRNEFSTYLREKRAQFNEKFKEQRDSFSSQEKRERESFLSKLKDERDSYMNGHGRTAASKERQDFFNDQDQRRRAFFAEETAKRRTFEAKVAAERSAFEQDVRDRQSRFNQLAAEYTTRFHEMKRAKANQERMEREAKQAAERQKAAEPNPYAELFNSIPKRPGTPLGATDQ